MPSNPKGADRSGKKQKSKEEREKRAAPAASVPAASVPAVPSAKVVEREQQPSPTSEPTSPVPPSFNPAEASKYLNDLWSIANDLQSGGESITVHKDPAWGPNKAPLLSSIDFLPELQRSYASRAHNNTSKDNNNNNNNNNTDNNHNHPPSSSKSPPASSPTITTTTTTNTTSSGKTLSAWASGPPLNV